MAFAWALILLVIATVAFHFASLYGLFGDPWWFTEIASNWTTMDQTVNVTFWVTGFVFIVINLFMAWTVVRYLHRKGKTEKAFASLNIGTPFVGPRARVLARGVVIPVDRARAPDSSRTVAP